MRRAHSYAPETLEALELLGLQVSVERRRRRWTAAELADRAGISVKTLRGVERGEPTVAAGTAFEVATLVGVPLFARDRSLRRERAAHEREVLSLLPARVRQAQEAPDDSF